MDTNNNTIEGVELTTLRIIEGELGNVMHALKRDEKDFDKFGEVYFSTVDQGKIKAWKRHRSMVMNIVVPVGEIKFVLYDDRAESNTQGNFLQINLSQKNYKRLYVPPKIWMGFQGKAQSMNLLVNIASIQHDPDECDRCELDELPYEWQVL